MHFLWEILQEILAGNLVGIFKICKSSSGSAAGNAVGNVVGKIFIPEANSKPIFTYDPPN